MNLTNLAAFVSRWLPCRQARQSAWLLTVVSVSTIAVNAQLVIEVGDRTIDAAASQTIDIMVENPTANPVLIAGLNFNLQLGSGGPVIQDVDLITGTLFASNNQGQVENVTEPDRWASTVVTLPATPTVSLGAFSSAKVATILIDGTGFAAGGPWALNLNDTFNGSTRYIDSAPDALPNIITTITDGTISVVPEPSSSMAVAGLLLGAAAFARRWRAKAVK